MPVLKYRDPSTGQYVEFAGTTGATGPTGPRGPINVSTDPGNAAKIGIDRGILVNTLPITQPTGDAKYLQLIGGEIKGPLSVQPTPTANEHVVPKSYVDTKVNAASKVWVQASIPSSPSAGDIFLKT